MSLTGTGSLSLKKTDLSSDRTSGTYRKVQFAHKAAGGETGINLAAMTLPSSEMPGFVQPTQAELAACQLLFNQRNLTLTSSVRGTLIPFMSYVVGSSTQINFTDSFGTALPGEVFVGVIDGTNRDGVSGAAASSIVATGTLLAGASDFNVGAPFVTNLYPTQQIGAVLVYLDGQLMMRNSGNATAAPSADGNYQEVSSGGGYSNLIRFNIVDNLNDRAVTVVSNGSMVEQPSGSIKATVETLAGQQDAVIQTVAALAGVPTSNFYAAPNNVDMLSFGNSVLALNQSAALKNVSNTFTQPQNIPGKTDGTAVAPGYIGERITWATPPSLQAATTSLSDWTNANIVLTPGTWQIFGSFFVTGTTATSIGAAATTVVQITDASNTVVQNMESQMYIINSGSSALTIGSTVALYGTVSINTTTTYKVRLQKAEAAATCQIYNTAFARSVFYAVRIA
jgi:hypothetical protein